MIFMIRIFSILMIFLLVSCNGLTILDFYSAYKGFQSNKSDEIKITDEFIDNQRFSFIDFRFNGYQLIMPLLSVKGSELTWISADGIEVVTKNGKIIKINNSDFDFYSVNLDFNCSDGANFTYDIFFSNPFMFESQSSVIDVVDEICFENVYSHGLKSNFKNIYKFDSEGQLFYSNQFIRSDISEFEINFYLK